jgi:tripartite ATP-independent transporter DctM subunit
VLDKAGNYIDRVLKPVTNVVNSIGTSILLLMVLLMGVNVFLRYFVGKPVVGTLELEEFMLVILVFFGIAYTAVQKRHVKVDLVLSRLPHSVRPVINSITSLISLGLCSLMVWRVVVYALAKWEQGAQSITLGVPFSPFIFLAAFGGALLAVALMAELLRSLAEVARSRQWLLFGAGCVLVSLLFGAIVWLHPPAEAMAFIGFGILLLFLALGMYIAFVMLLVGFFGSSYISGINAGFHYLGKVPFETVADYSLCVIAFFVLMGYICSEVGISRDLYNTTHKWLGQLPGGLAMATIAGCTGFGAICGDSFATAAVMGSAALPEMKRYNYSPQLATGCVAAGGTLGTMIPPSIGMIFYCIITDQSIGKLFLAGILPGLLLASMFMLLIYGQARLNPQLAPRGPRVGFKERLLALRGTWAMLILFLLVIGGIYMGIFTPTEAGAIGACGALIIGLAKRELRWQRLVTALLESGRTVAMLFIILIGAFMLSYFLAASEAPFLISNFVVGLAINRYVILALVLLIYVFLGCVMNIVPAMIITLPIFFPTIIGLGFDPIWFGIIMVVMMEMGMITPPIGMNTFVIKGVAQDIPIETIFRGIFPFVLAMVLGLVILTLFPQIALFLPSMMK